MACTACKTLFFGLWSLFYIPVIVFLSIDALAQSVVTRVSVNQVVTLLFVLVNAGLLEFYLLFRFAQSLQSASLCTRGIFRCRRRAIIHTVAPKTTANGDRTGTQCPITRFIGKIEDAVHGSSKGQLAVLILSISNTFLFSAILYALCIGGLGGSFSYSPRLPGSETLQRIIGSGMVFLTLLGTASFIPYLAFRAVIAIEFVTRPSARMLGMARATRDEEHSLLSSKDEENF